MALQAGVRLGPYEVLSVLGAGGMGEVYRARDTRLDRTVAIKVLPSELSSLPSWRQRFEREAKTLSSLSHPHICALHDIGAQDGLGFLVMELLEGETLFERLRRSRRMSIDEVLEIAIQIADALDTAHRKGVIHRDLKPGNVMLTKSGAKLLDFGLAKHAQSAIALPSQSAATTAAPITSEGTILGTLSYMAPEQLEGREADARTDIFAFGAVLYEMATGKRAFEGKSQVSLMAAIVEHDPPPVSSLAPLSPPWLDHLVKGCLAKDPEKRWQSMADVLTQLRLIAEGPQTGPQPTLAGRRWPLWIGGAVVIAALIMGIPAALRPAATPVLPRMQFDLQVPDTAQPYQMAFSPTGSHLAVTVTEKGVTRLWVRAMGSAPDATVQASVLPATIGAASPTWSPDERYLAFFAGDKLKKVDRISGEVMTLADATGRGLAWNRDDVILFTQNRSGVIYRVSASESAGAVTQVTELDKARHEVAHIHPQFLPDGKHFIYLALSEKSENSGVFVASLDAPGARLVVNTETKAAFVVPHHLLYTRTTDSYGRGTLLTRRFDPAQLRLEGEPVPVVENLGINFNNAIAAFTVSQTGMLAYRGLVFRTTNSTLRWFDRTGRSSQGLQTPAEYQFPVLSPNGRRAIVLIIRNFSEADLWMIDLERGTSMRFTSDRAIESLPQWSHDGGRIAFWSNRLMARGLYEKNVDGVTPEKLLLKSDGLVWPDSWSPDGDYLLYRAEGLTTLADIWVLPLRGNRDPEPFVRSPFAELGARFSPDGKWVAFHSNESGRDEVYLVPFPKATTRLQISTAGGSVPRWRGDGKELFYVAPSGDMTTMMAVDIDLSAVSNPRIGLPRTLFAGGFTYWDVTRDGRRFLIVVPAEESPNARLQPPLRIMVNWQPQN